MHEIKLCVKVWVNVAFSLKSFERSVTLRKKYLHTTSCFSQEYGGTLEQKNEDELLRDWLCTRELIFHLIFSF